MKAKFQRSVYILSLVVLASGLVMQIIGHNLIQKYDFQRAVAFAKAINQQGAFPVNHDIQTERLRSSINTIWVDGQILIDVGVGLSLLWVFCGGRRCIWLPLSLFLVDVVVWIF